LAISVNSSVRVIRDGSLFLETDTDSESNLM